MEESSETRSPNAGEPAGSPRHPSLESRIRACYARLPESERRIADVILDFPGQLAAYSATELASLAGVSKAAATRLFKRLGFESFTEARRMVRDAQNWGSPLYLNRRAPAAPDPKRELADAISAHTSALKLSMERVDHGQLEAAVRGLLDAPRVWTLGFRNSHFIAAYARSQLLQLRSGVTLLPGPGETIGEYTADFSPRDVLLAVGLRRRVVQFRRTVEAAREAGCRVLVITDPTGSDLRRLSDWHLICELDSNHLFDTYVGAMALVHYMCVLAMREAGRDGRQRLELIEIQHERLSEFY